MKKTVFVIEKEDAERYKKSLLAVRTRLIRSFIHSDDKSYRKWVNAHGPVLDELLEELGHRFR